MFRGKKWILPACKDLFQNVCCFFFGFNLTSLVRELHREQMSIEHSMQDLDSAVGKLDNILMFLYVIIATLIIAVALVIYSFLTFSVWFVHPFFFFRRLS